MMNRRSFTIGFVAANAATISTLSARFSDQSMAATKRSIAVEITDFEFVGSEGPFSPGDEITWINRDIAPHTGTAADGSWDSGRLNTGEHWTKTITKGQVASYFCRFHPMMKAHLRIQ